jgi:hypothetical protein
MTIYSGKGPIQLILLVVVIGLVIYVAFTEKIRNSVLNAFHVSALQRKTPLKVEHLSIEELQKECQLFMNVWNSPKTNEGDHADRDDAFMQWNDLNCATVMYKSASISNRNRQFSISKRVRNWNSNSGVQTLQEYQQQQQKIDEREKNPIQPRLAYGEQFIREAAADSPDTRGWKGRRLGIIKSVAKLSTQSNSGLNMCRKMKKKHAVEVGAAPSWGTLPSELQNLWISLNCNDFFRVDETVEATTSSIFKQQKSSESLEAQHMHSMTNGDHVTDDYVKDTMSSTNQHKKQAVQGMQVVNEVPRVPFTIASRKVLAKDQVKNNVVDTALVLYDPANDVVSEMTALPKMNPVDMEWCSENLQKYDVIPQKSWGRLPQASILSWKSRKCDLTFTVKRMMKNAVSSCSAENYSKSSELPLISILAASTSRKVEKPSVRNLSLFIYLLPSLIRTLDCGFRYEYTLGYDVGDPFYDTEKGMASVDAWFAENVIKPLGKNGILILPIRKVRVNNTLRKPGPVFNEMARGAYEGGADYMYRVNDDTEFLHHWPNTFVESLNTIPNKIGAVGPTCTQGNTDILTHDFVARIHMDIHEMNYYPPELVDWWMDDWISYVYGPKRTFRASQVHVVHHTGAHGRRYQVNNDNRSHLGRLMNEGKVKIRNWLLKTNADDSIIKSWDKNVSKNWVFRHKDVPARYLRGDKNVKRAP